MGALSWQAAGSCPDHATKHATVRAPMPRQRHRAKVKQRRLEAAALLTLRSVCALPGRLGLPAGPADWLEAALIPLD